MNWEAVANCRTIYQPRGQAGEYSRLATNPYIGCGHKCVYCYVPNVMRMSREVFDKGALPRKNYLDKLRGDAAKYKKAGIAEQVMLSFTTDPYHPFDNTLTRETLEVLASHGMGFCTLTKGGKRALRDIDLFRPEMDAFASTLTSLDASFSQKWERGAADPEDRIATLKAFSERGIFTWVSLEPTLDAEASIKIIEATHTFVNLYKIGKANYIKLPHEIDWESYTHQVLDCVNRLGVKHYIKRDLQGYLPQGYPNERHIQQNFGA